ncbi:DsbA family oxidoreductase [Gracilibacillus dipsosauri]|uniref:DsbA family oxidoreductase n=1 Tax=Gracilibacillus dipsosauri TaxID=178340 RepID=UPI00240A7FB3
MKIEIWSDFVCPYCYIGKRRLELALYEFEYRDRVKIEFKSFELDPDSQAKPPNQSIHEYLALKKGMPLEDVKRMHELVGKQAAAIGLIYNFDTMQHTNTFDAHRLAKYAEKKNLGAKMTEKLLHAYFTDSELISDHHILKRLAIEVGLDGAEVEELLATNRYANRVREDQELASEMGVGSVPFFVFNEKYAISGAQPKEIFKQILQKVWEEDQEQFELQSNPKTSYCTGEECDLKNK